MDVISLELFKFDRKSVGAVLFAVMDCFIDLSEDLRVTLTDCESVKFMS